jgi:hypothetical protein
VRETSGVATLCGVVAMFLREACPQGKGLRPTQKASLRSSRPTPHYVPLQQIYIRFCYFYEKLIVFGVCVLSQLHNGQGSYHIYL